MNYKHFTALLVVLLFLIIPVHATTMFELSLQNLSTGSDKVVQAKVTAIVTQWDKDKEIIYTYIRMNIIDDLIGDDEDNEIIIKQPGGKLNGKTLYVEGTSSYKVGEDIVAFLFTDPMNLSAFQTVGMYQGKYIIYTENGILKVRQDTSEGVRLISKTGGQTVVTGDTYTLDEFKTIVIDYINESRNK